MGVHSKVATDFQIDGLDFSELVVTVRSVRASLNDGKRVTVCQTRHATYSTTPAVPLRRLELSLGPCSSLSGSSPIHAQSGPVSLVEDQRCLCLPFCHLFSTPPQHSDCGFPLVLPF
jgi:hypothetical protein